MTAHPALAQAQAADWVLCPERTQRPMDVLRREVAVAACQVPWP